MKRKIISVLVIAGIIVLGSGVPAYSAVPYSSAALINYSEHNTNLFLLALSLFLVGKFSRAA